MYNGHRYTVMFENVSVTNAAQDLIELTASSSVPFVFERAVVTCGSTTQTIGRLKLLKRTTAGSGGTSVTPRALDPAGPSASTSVNRTVTTPGTGGNELDAAQWNIVTPAEFNHKPAGITVGSGERLAINLAAALGAAQNMSVMVEFREIK